MNVDHHVCPWQGGALLTVWVRKFLNDPVRITKPYLSPGATAMDVGCGMGFFTIPMSRLVGASGKVIAVDVQPEMLAGLQANATKAGCDNVIAHQCDPQALGVSQWDGTVDFAILFYMLHEAPDPQGLIDEVFAVLKPGGKLLFAEPVMHVNNKEFSQEASLFTEAGLKVIDEPHIPISRTIVLAKA